MLNKVENISQLMNPEYVKKFRILEKTRIHKREEKEALKETTVASWKSFKLENN